MMHCKSKEASIPDERFVCEDLNSTIATVSQMALAAVSFKVVILLLFNHCMMLLPFDGFVFLTCFVV